MKYISVLVQHHAGPTGNVLLAKKPGGSWELPHGVVRTNESEAAAAARVCWELLGLDVKVGKLAMEARKSPQDGYVEHIACGNITHNTHTKCNYHAYYEAVNTWQAEPKSAVYSEFLYVHPTQLAQYGLEGDDAVFLAKFDPYVNAAGIPQVRMP